MSRPWLLGLPVLAAAIAVAAQATAAPAVSVGAVAAVVGLLTAVGLDRAVAARAEQAAERLHERVGPAQGSVPAARGWQALADSIDAAAAATRERVDELAAERAKVLGLLERLAPAILLFDAGGLAYANRSARDLFALDDASVRTPMQVLGDADLADAVERTRRHGGEVGVATTRGDRILEARLSRGAGGDVALVVDDVSGTRRLESMRRDFVTNASHELKTPVAGIQALSDSLALALRSDPVRAERMVGRLEHEAARLARLVRDLLDLARLEEAGSDRRRTAVDLPEVVRGQADRVAAVAEERGVTVRLDLPDEATVRAVPEDVRLIVDNLLENAVRYNRADGRVDVRVRVAEDAVELLVADSGIGIPEADRDRIFERFYRIDKGRSRAAGGTGLGLSLVRNAVQRLGGRLTLDSELGQGSTFRVQLPRGAASTREGAASR